MIRARRVSSSVCVIVLLSFRLRAFAQEIRLGAEFQVNTFTNGAQRFPSVAKDADGDFVIVWESYGQDGSLQGIFGARFSSAGSRLATEFQVNSYTQSRQARPQVAEDADGDFVAVWQSESSYGFAGHDGDQSGVFGQRFSSTGTPLAGEFQVNTVTISDQRVPSVAMDADGDFVVAWQSGNQDSASSPGIFARRFSSSGVAQASEFQVNSYTPLNQIYPSVGADLDGDFVVVWQDRYHDGSGQYGVFARRFSSAGTGLATEFQVNTYTINSQNNAAVAVAPGGDFVVVWESVYQYGPGRSVFAQRFSSVGTPAGVEFRINFGSEAAVGIDSEGDFVIAWDRSSPNEVLGRRFSSAGTSLSTEFQANTYDTGTQSYSSIAVQADEHFVIAWQDGGRDGSDLGIFAQRFKGPATLDIDGNGVLQPLSDGLLVLRKLFGFTGATLIGGAVGNGCTRCDATAIEAYINGLGLVLDIDGNTTLGALTDGLLVLRYLFGFTGGTLTTGAVGGGCSRCDAATIEPYLQGLV